MKRLAKTCVITWIYGIAWILIEWLIYGEITGRVVDDIMLVLFGVIVYCLLKNPVSQKFNVVKEFDALEECPKRMKAFEEKYKLSSKDILSGNYDSNMFVDHVNDKDLYLWEMYIRTFLACGGKLDDRNI